MIDWGQAKQQIAETFFKDLIELYVNDTVENSLGEEVEKPVLVGEYLCNVENQANSVKYGETGASIPRSVRISLTKDALLDDNHSYKVKMKSVRLTYDSSQWWRVDSWVEGQISTVLTVSREVAI